MPNRVIKESIRTSRSVSAMTDFQFRLWIYLITYVDDYGRGSADPELLKGLVFPRMKRVREQDIASALAELAGKGAIHLYEVDGESLFYFPNWSEHQRIQTKRSKFPDPPKTTEIPANQQAETGIHGDSPWPTVNHGYNPIQSESESESESEVVTRTRARFTPPNADQVAAYAQEMGKTIDAQRFVDFYACKGWKVGCSPMKDWKAAARNWIACDSQPAPARGPKVVTEQRYTQRTYTHDDSEAMAIMGLDPKGGTT